MMPAPPPEDAAVPIDLPHHMASHRIADENSLPGDPDWLRPFADGEVQGYASATSYARGDRVSIHAATSGATGQSHWDLYRVGYYGGAGARKVGEGGTVEVPSEPIPPPDPRTGRIECAWRETLSFPVDDSMPPGAYAVRFTAPSGDMSYVPFVVRDDGAPAAVLILIPTNTWTAYNRWGGTSLYENYTMTFGGSRAYEASANRPLDDGGIDELLHYERLFLYFVEGQGYDVAYASDDDLERDPTIVDGRELLVIEGHSEYWSGPMRDTVARAVAAGTSLASFSGNEIYWQVRLEPASDGTPRRTVTCYKDDAPLRDPLYGIHPELATVRWRSPPVSRPENAQLGNMFQSIHDSFTPFAVRAPQHWVLDGTGFTAGDLLPGLFGYESDTTWDNQAAPPNLVVLGDGVVLSREGNVGHAATTIAPSPAGGFIFGGGSIEWANALSDAHLWDRRVQRMVENLFARADGRAAHDPLPLVLPDPSAAPTYTPAQVTTIFAGAPLQNPVGLASMGDDLLVADAGAGAIFKIHHGDAKQIAGGLASPTGIVVGGDGALYVTEAVRNTVTRVTLDGKTAILAGQDGVLGYADGAGTKALFNIPTGICLGSDGALLVSDGENGALRRVTLDGNVTTLGRPKVDVQFAGALACAQSGTTYVLDTVGYALVPFTGGLAGRPVVGGDGSRGVVDGPIATAMLGGGRGLVLDADCMIFTEPATATVRRIDNGAITTLAGGARSDLSDGSGAAAGFVAPAGMVFLGDGSLAIADAGLAAIRKLVLPK
jgi:hypothetical protein